MSSNYYTSAGSKVGDFFIGFAGIPLLFAFFFSLLSGVLRQQGALALWVVVGALIVGPIFFFSIGRRFIAIGILCTLILPALAFGACLIALSGARF